MVDIEGITLHKLLEAGDLEAFSRIKSAFFSSSYSPLYREINKFYLKYGEVPSFNQLELIIRDSTIKNNLVSLRDLDVPEDADLDLAVDALISKFAQSCVLEDLDKLLDSITLYEVDELKDSIASIVLNLDDKLHTDENIIYADQVQVFRPKDETDSEVVPTGISNDYDANVGGFFDEELILVGGRRGSGKSVLCANLVAAQYEAGRTSVYYTIEMTYTEIFHRIIAILAKVPQASIRRNSLTAQEELAVVKVRADMFLEADDLVEEYSSGHIDAIKFEQKLTNTKKLRPDKQIIIVDDRDMSLAGIDLSLQKFEAQFGDNLSLAVVDYVNQLVMNKASSDKYDWKEQIQIATKLKNLCRKYKIPIVAPYQIDASGEARFSKGILDSCDIAFILEAGEEFLALKCTKARSSDDEFEYYQPMDWDTLRMDPTTMEKPQPKVEEEEDSYESYKPKYDKTRVDDI